MNTPFAILTLVVALVVGVGSLFMTGNPQRGSSRPTQQTDTRAARLSEGKCSGTGVPYKLSVSPMKPEDFSMIIPYGLMIGNHVTPIDHQYFAPMDADSPRDAYEVRAMADSRLISIQPRTDKRGTEYRMVFSVSCTFLYYYDLVTSLAPDIQAAYDAAGGGSRQTRGVDIRVKAGQVIGRIGGQTLDFAVWDTTKKLTGFIVPEHYDEEPWKLYTVDPLDYYTDDLKALVLSKYTRTTPPISGKIDYDVDGKLIGNWFLKGTDGYRGAKEADFEHYSKTHLAFAPDHMDPSRFVVSMGEDFRGREDQYMDVDNAPDPATISVDSGLVSYDLLKWTYRDSSGQIWSRMTDAEGIKAEPFLPVVGCALVQMNDARTITFEVRSGACSTGMRFSAAAKTYTR